MHRASTLLARRVLANAASSTSSVAGSWTVRVVAVRGGGVWCECTPYTAGFVQARCMSSGSSKVVASAEAAVADIKDGSKL